MWQFPTTEAQVLALNLQRRDIVSTWRPDVYLFEPNVVPTTVPLVYSVTIEGRTFSTTQSPGASLTDIATALYGVLVVEQSIVAVFIDGATLLIYGALGQVLTVTLTTTLTLLQRLPAIAEGPSPGKLHILYARSWWTKDTETGEPVPRQTYRVRREIVGPVNVAGHPALVSTTPFLDVTSAEIRTIIARAEDIP